MKGTKVSCNVCKRTYASRNKLFEHVKSSGHALRLDVESENSTEVKVAQIGKKKQSKKKHK